MIVSAFNFNAAPPLPRPTTPQHLMLTPSFSTHPAAREQPCLGCNNSKRRRRRRQRTRTIQYALPTLHDVGFDPLHMSAFADSILHHDILQTSTSGAANHFPSAMLSDAAAASVDPDPHLTAREILREVKDEVSREIQASESGENMSVYVSPEMEKAAMNDVGHDLIIFLTIAVVVAPVSSALNISPVLLYLLFGLVTGPHGMSLLRGGEDVGFELGDFGILFLLFVEGLNLSPERLKELGSFFSLGATQLLLSVGVIFFGFFVGGPLLFQLVSNPSVPIDPLIVQLLEQPVVAFSIAAAGALSSSAFVLPILKEKGWEDRPDGIAALSILLLQDLAVAPLLVVLPLIANVDGGSGGSDPIALGILAFKATVGFGAVLALASVVLRRVFQVVATARSSQSFVAASLLVAVGMGVVSDFLGLSSTTGAFAAGVLLAESGYRAQIEADIKPFEGILLGIFFVTAGSALDPAIVLQYWPTLLVGITSFLLIKFSIIFSAGGALGISRGDAARVGLLLAGGGEFAFVVFRLASDSGIIDDSLCGLLTASVIISMALTPVLGEFAEYVGGKLDAQGVEESKELWFNSERDDIDYDVNTLDEEKVKEAFSRFDKDGNGEITAEELQDIFCLVGERDVEGRFLTLDQVKTIIRRFDDNDDGVLQYEEFAQLWMAKRRSAMSPTALSRAVVVCGYNEVGQQLCKLLDKANIAGIPYVAFARKTDQISASIEDGARVIYGDGTSAQLIIAAGVSEPTAIAITYSDCERNLAATSILRDSFPDTPIFVRADEDCQIKEIIRAGATEVICSTGSVASGFGTLLGVRRSNRFGGVVDDSDAAVQLSNLATPLYPSVTNDSKEPRLSGLAKQLGTDPPDLSRRLFRLFSTSVTLDDDGKVQLRELVDELLRTAEFSVNDEQFRELLECETLNEKCLIEAEERFVSFSEFVSLYKKATSIDKETQEKTPTDAEVGGEHVRGANGEAQ